MKNAMVVELCLLGACRGNSGDIAAEPTRTTRVEGGTLVAVSGVES